MREDDIKELVKKLFEFKAQEAIDLKEKNAIIDQLIKLDVKKEDILRMPYSSYEEIPAYEEGMDDNQRLIAFLPELSKEASDSDLSQIIIEEEILISINKIIFLSLDKAKIASGIKIYIDILSFINNLEILFNKCNMPSIISQINKRLLNDLTRPITEYIKSNLKRDIANCKISPEADMFVLLSVIAENRNFIINSNIVNNIISYVEGNEGFLDANIYPWKSAIDRPKLFKLLAKLINLNLTEEELLEKIGEYSLRSNRLPEEKRFIMFEILIPKIGLEKSLQLYLSMCERRKRNEKDINITVSTTILSEIENQDYKYCKEFIDKIFESLNSKGEKLEFVKKSFESIIFNINLDINNKLDILDNLYNYIYKLESLDVTVDTKSTSSIIEKGKSTLSLSLIEKIKTKFLKNMRENVRIFINDHSDKGSNPLKVTEENEIKSFKDMKETTKNSDNFNSLEKEEILEEIFQLELGLQRKSRSPEDVKIIFEYNADYLLRLFEKRRSDLLFEHSSFLFEPSSENKLNISDNDEVIKAPITPKISRDNERSLEK